MNINGAPKTGKAVCVKTETRSSLLAKYDKGKVYIYTTLPKSNKCATIADSSYIQVYENGVMLANHEIVGRKTLFTRNVFENHFVPISLINTEEDLFEIALSHGLVIDDTVKKGLL